MNKLHLLSRGEGGGGGGGSSSRVFSRYSGFHTSFVSEWSKFTNLKYVRSTDLHTLAVDVLVVLADVGVILEVGRERLAHHLAETHLTCQHPHYQ